MFRLWFVTKDAFAVADLVFTGLPVIGICSGQDGLTQQYGRGTVVIQDPDDEDVVTMSCKDSAAQVKMNYRTGTVSFKLCKKDYREERNLRLLGLGKHTSWKLYPVDERDESALREMLSVYVWNSVCGEERLQRKMEYAEVIIDGAYSGLYYLAPKLGRGYLELDGRDRLYKAEGIPEEDPDLSQIDTDNYTDYHIWMQAACAVRADVDDHCIIAREDKGSYLFSRMPERSKYVFGIYPSEIGWESLQAAESVMEDRFYERMAAESGGTAAQELAEKLQRLRNGALATEAIRQYAGGCERRLQDSGYLARNEKQESHEAACLEVSAFIGKRLQYLDEVLFRNREAESYN